MDLFLETYLMGRQKPIKQITIIKILKIEFRILKVVVRERDTWEILSKSVPFTRTSETYDCMTLVLDTINKELQNQMIYIYLNLRIFYNTYSTGICGNSLIVFDTQLYTLYACKPFNWHQFDKQNGGKAIRNEMLGEEHQQMKKHYNGASELCVS